MIIQGSFSHEFLDSIPALEKDMLEHGLNTEDFILAKGSSYYRGGNDYTVVVQEQSFTVRLPTDGQFLQYFYNICFPPEQQSQDMQNVGIMPNEHTVKALLQRLEKWIMADPLEQEDNKNL